jgi:hypothetical protein
MQERERSTDVDPPREGQQGAGGRSAGPAEAAPTQERAALAEDCAADRAGRDQAARRLDRERAQSEVDPIAEGAEVVSCPIWSRDFDGRGGYCSGACRTAPSRARRIGTDALMAQILELRAARPCRGCGQPVGRRRRSDARWCTHRRRFTKGRDGALSLAGVIA